MEEERPKSDWQKWEERRSDAISQSQRSILPQEHDNCSGTRWSHRSNPLDSIDVTSASPNSYRAPGVGLIAGFDLSHLIGALPTFANRFLGVPLPYVDQKFGVVEIGRASC